MDSNPRSNTVRDFASLRAETSTYPGLRPAVRWVARYALRARNQTKIEDFASAALREGGLREVPPSARDGAWRERAAQALFQWITTNVDYTQDPPGTEQVQEPLATVMMGEGDCDDLVSLSVSMLQAVAVPARIVVIRQSGSDVYNHIYAEYLGSDRGRDRWRPFDATLHEPDKGKRSKAGDGPPESVIAEKVTIPVLGTGGQLGPQTERALSNLPAGDGVVPQEKLRQEKRSSRSVDAQSLSSLRSQPSGVGMAASTSAFSSTSGDLITSSNAPGTVTAEETISEQAGQEQEGARGRPVVLVSPTRYRTIVEQRSDTGRYQCDIRGRMIIRDSQGREILPSSDVDEDAVEARTGVGQYWPWILLGTGVVATLAIASTDDSENQTQ